MQRWLARLDHVTLGMLFQGGYVASASRLTHESRGMDAAPEQPSGRDTQGAPGAGTFAQRDRPASAAA